MWSRGTGFIGTVSCEGKTGMYGKKGDCFIESDQLLTLATATDDVVDKARNDNSSRVLTRVVDWHRRTVEARLPIMNMSTLNS